VINRVSAHDLQQKDILAQLDIQILQTTDVQEFRSYQDEYTYLVTDQKRLEWIAKSVTKFSETGNTLVLVNRIETGERLVDMIDNSVFINGSVKLDERKEEYDEIKTSDGKIIVATYGVAAVGINIPRIFNLVLLEPGKSFVRVIQSIGRGIRKAEDKDFVQIWDITSSCKFAKRHLSQRKAFYKEASYPFDIEKLNYK
jgi:superfamily II DNA or RNA helicase